ncbi:protein-glucosylgalactosylhydroxylysine glucosidase [Stomoxys calcitrans]|uniref:protein-glucosylgalactosylhydroxylysine glucosidase n=1 Tax=Stomoxys calcitrans TaxID=35570 RepID=UPI0027E3396F|nr:protein-glucosylgalactosylhydroxylysine glucosidase [Stomoxys calcitrans]
MKALIFIIMVASSHLLLLEAKIGREFVLEPPRLPSDLNFMPSISNGNLGLTVFGDAIYVNGVYNGFKGESRRARFPNWLNISANIQGTQSDDLSQVQNVTYSMNLLNGYFQWTHRMDDLGVTLTQRVYAHRFYNRALIYEMIVERETSEAALTIELSRKPGAHSDAIDLVPVTLNTDDIEMVQATTREIENKEFQANRTRVYVAFSENFEDNQNHLKIEIGQNILSHRHVITMDAVKQLALAEIREILAQNQKQIFEKHCSSWQEFWNQFHIEVKHNMGLSQIINAGIFYMTSSLPSLKSRSANNPFYGLSPTGLSRGQLDDDYEGHNFWDTEIWMLPAITQMESHWSEQLFSYRLNHLSGATFNANHTGYAGARFPWESAFTGTEVTNPCCPEVAEQEIHISADIAASLEGFYATTFDHQWLCGTAWPLIREIASFLCSRTELNATTGKYHIKNVMGPDEDHANVDDNVYTNVVFQKALRFASYAQSQCSPELYQSSVDWLEQANKMFIPYDAAKDYHPQHVGYMPGQEIKQADTILLGYPLQFDMHNSTRYNDLLTYENVTRKSGPAMTWSMFAINFLDVGDKKKAIQFFTRGYEEYVHPEFKVWSETKIGLQGSANFLTGIGGFLQSIINGFAGIRFYLDTNSNTTQMLIRGPTLLPDTSDFKVKGIKFANSTFSLHVRRLGQKNIFKCLQLGNQNLELVIGYSIIPLQSGSKIHFEKEKIIVRTTR